MSANPSDTESTVPTAKEAPTAQQSSQPGVPKKITNAQTVCNEKNEKGKLCNGFLKQLRTGGEEAKKHLRGDDVLFKCQTCGALYIGPPLGHVRDPKKQSRFVEKELMAILQAAGGTLPAFKMSERGTLVPVEDNAHHAPPAPAATAKPATTPIPKPATTAAGSSSAPASQVRDSSAQADAHRPAAEAQAATGQASAAPMSPAAATASPAAGAETVADLAPEASTELTPGAPPDTRQSATSDSPGAATPSTETEATEQK
jgi:hypothetical protein